MNYFMLEPIIACCRVSICGEVHQPHSFIERFVVETEFSGLWTRYTCLDHPGVEITKHDFSIEMGSALVLALYALIEDIVEWLVFLFHRSVDADERYVEESRFVGDCG